MTSRWIKNIKEKYFYNAYVYCKFGWEAYICDDIDCGCLMNKDNEGYCLYRFIPNFIKDLMIKRKEKEEIEHWDKKAKHLKNSEELEG